MKVKMQKDGNIHAIEITLYKGYWCYGTIAYRNRKSVFKELKKKGYRIVN